MENVKIILDTGEQENVNGIFYIFNSKYYFIYTSGEFDGDDYIKLYVSQVCKEIKNTPNGPIDTGYMLGMEISNVEEWKKVQESITKIVEDKKNGTQSSDIQYLPMSMLVNLKIVSKNKFKLMRNIVEENFKVNIIKDNNDIQQVVPSEITQAVEPVQSAEKIESTITENNNINDNYTSIESEDDVIIDYRARFFEEQEKTQQLEEQIKQLNEKLDSIKSIIG